MLTTQALLHQRNGLEMRSATKHPTQATVNKALKAFAETATQVSAQSSTVPDNKQQATAQLYQQVTNLIHSGSNDETIGQEVRNLVNQFEETQGKRDLT